MVTNIFVTNIFRDRKDAGQYLARRLTKYRNRDDVVVLALPRDGVPVAYEVAKALNAPLDIFVVSNSLDVTGKTVIIVDDGMATGSTMRAAVRAVRKKKPRKIVIAVPVGEREVCDSFRHEADTDIICAMMPQPFNAVDTFYRHFAPTTDVEVQQLLRQVQQTKAAA